MRAIDTNVLVRYVVNDEPRQNEAVDVFLKECRANFDRVFISIPVLVELVWVLERTYRQSKAEIVATLEKLLDLALFQFDRESAVLHGFAQYRRGRAGLADYLIGELSVQAGCRDTVTFDRALRGAPGFTIL